MTTLGLTMAGRQRRAESVRTNTMLRQVLLGCGILSSLLYIATDVLGGLRYDGYSFTSQAISELMAVGAPSEGFVDPLFILYGVLAVVFGIAVFREGAARSRLRITGALVIAYALLGLTGPLFFEMSQRGAGATGNDLGHIVLTAALVLCLLLTIGFGANALGRRFRAYSWATLLIVIAFGVVSATFGARLAAGEPTPGFGIVERIHVYAFLLWMAVFAIGLLRHRDNPAPVNPVMT
jgi:hypothetical membrane protein